jgi:hypothetical protein
LYDTVSAIFLAEICNISSPGAEEPLTILFLKRPAEDFQVIGFAAREWRFFDYRFYRCKLAASRLGHSSDHYDLERRHSALFLFGHPKFIGDLRT